MATTYLENSVTASEKRPERLFRNVTRESDCYTLIWLDENVNSNEENIQTKKKLRQIISQLIIFEDIIAWIQSSINFTTRKVILLVSEAYGRQIVPVIHSFPQMKAIYVYSSAETTATWTGNYKKVRFVDKLISSVNTSLALQCHGVFRQPDELIRDIAKYKRHIERVRNDSMVLSGCDTQQTGIASAEKDSKNAIFMFFQVLIDVLLKMTSDGKSTAKQDLIDHFKRIYEGDAAQLQDIAEFENEYRSGKAVWWYSRCNLFFFTLNKALRDSDYEVLFAMRFFITDLYAQLTSEHQSGAASSQGKDPILRVYRGQNISTREMNYLKRNKGQFISFQSFLSTSLDRGVARFFADAGAPITVDNTRILFQFNIDTRIQNTKPYANVTHLSSYGNEKEVLIMLGCIFRVDQVDFSKLEQCWIANLSLCSEDNYELNDLMKQTKSDIGDDITSLGCLLARRGDYEQAKNYYVQLLLESSTAQLDRARCYHGLGAIAAALGHYDQALEYQSKELEIHVKRSNRTNIALTHMVMGETYWKKGDLDTALAHEKKACQILRSSGNPQLSNVYLTMGSIYKSKKDLELAIQYYEKALELNRQRLPANHEDFGIIYSNMGLTYALRQEPEKALEYCLKGKEVLLKSLPPTHAKISEIEGYIRSVRGQIEQNKKS